MISFREAALFAKQERGDYFNYYEEFLEVFLFYDNNDLFSYDSENAPVVVERATGRVYGLSEYQLMYPKRISERRLIMTGIMEDCYKVTENYPDAAAEGFKTKFYVMIDRKDKDLRYEG